MKKKESDWFKEKWRQNNCLPKGIASCFWCDILKRSDYGKRKVTVFQGWLVECVDLFYLIRLLIEKKKPSIKILDEKRNRYERHK